jgi:hypothetical protein
MEWVIPFHVPVVLIHTLIADGTFTMRADDKKVANLSPGRESVRLVSNDLFGDGVYIFDIDHIPLGCGTVRFLFVPLLPASMTQSVPSVASSMDNNSQAMALGRRNRCTRRGKFPGKQLDSYRPPTQTSTSTLSTSPSPKAGDPSSRPSNSYESVNVVSLHTAPNCYMAAANTSALTTMTGMVNGTDCSGLSPGNVGCGVQIPGPSFGINFNTVGGGVYAMWRDLQKCVRFAPQLNFG